MKGVAIILRTISRRRPSGPAYFGRPYNNLLITALEAMGLTQADYTKFPGQDGFGRYDPAGYARDGQNYARFTSTSAERNAPLPGLWAGG